MGYIYKITNTITGGIYVGQTTKTIKQRFAIHLKEIRKRKINDLLPLYKDIVYYGKKNFKIEVLEEVGNNEDLKDLEIHYINKLGSKRSVNPNNYNIRNGGSSLKPKIEYKMPYILLKISPQTMEIVKEYTSYEEIYKDYPRYKYQNIIKACLGYVKIAYGFNWKRRNAN